MIYVGIDNGNAGAIVAIEAETRQCVFAEVMPLVDVGKSGSPGAKNLVVDEARLWVMLDTLAAAYKSDLFVVLEKAQSMPGQGVASMFKYGVGYGVNRALLTALAAVHGSQWTLAHPATWQKSVLRDIEGTDTKARAVLKCARSLPSLDLYPGRKTNAHEGLADAGCMALYGEVLRPRGATIIPPPPPKRSLK